MSAPSGIKVPPAVSDAFASALRDSAAPRAVVFLIDGEHWTTHTTIPAKASYTDDIASLLPALPSRTTCASFAYRTDGKEWYLITYVPDDAGVRAGAMSWASSQRELSAPRHACRYAKRCSRRAPRPAS